MGNISEIHNLVLFLDCRYGMITSTEPACMQRSEGENGTKERSGNGEMEYRELSWPQRGKLWLRLGIRLVLTVLLILVLVWLVPPLLSLFMPFVVALVVAWLLNPLVRMIHQRIGISRKLVSFLLVLLLFCLAGGVLAYFVYAVAAEVVSLVNNWQAVWESFSVTGDAVLEAIRPFTDPLPVKVWDSLDQLLLQLSGWLETAIPTALGSLASGAGSFAMGVPSVAVGVVVFVMAAYFITADYPRIRFQVTRLFGGRVREHLISFKEIVSSAFGGYLRAEFFLSVGVFFILLAGFVITGQSYALLIALLLAVMDFIPIIGAGTVMVPWAVVDLVSGDFRGAIELMVIWGIICLFRRMGEPKFVGSQTGLSPILSLVSIYVGMRLAGVAGMILGPILCLVAIGVGRSGFFDNLRSDLRLAAEDVAAILKNKP